MYSVICNLVEGTKRYGIQGRETKVEDVTTDLGEAQRLAETLNRLKVSELHLMDVVQDSSGWEPV